MDVNWRAKSGAKPSYRDVKLGTSRSGSEIKVFEMQIIGRDLKEKSANHRKPQETESEEAF